jgi:predicted double-glycine peptidase
MKRNKSLVHHIPAIILPRRHGSTRLCPHCKKEMHDKDIYRDKKGWIFHRPCLMKGKGSIKLAGDVQVVHERQENDFNCGPAVLKSVENTIGVDHGSQDDYAKDTDADKDKGTPIVNLEAAAKEHGLEVQSHTGMDLTQIQESLQARKPVIVAVQLDGDEGGPADGWDHGHYVVITGLDDHYVTFMDPNSDAPERSWTIEEFLSRWHDHDYRGNVYRRWGMSVSHPLHVKDGFSDADDQAYLDKLDNCLDPDIFGDLECIRSATRPNL